MSQRKAAHMELTREDWVAMLNGGPKAQVPGWAGWRRCMGGVLAELWPGG